jgi:NADH-quinone oxidoreductase subunit L
MLVVSFLGESRSENAGHAHEVGVLMLVPLIVLMILSVFSGNHFVTDKLMAMAPVNHDHPAIVLYCSIGAMSVGALVGMLLYRGRKQEPLNIQLFANKFYVDEVYQVIIRVFHDGVAWLVSGLEKLIVHNLMTELPRATVRYFGFYSRKLQSGSLQHYTFYVGAGMLVVIYLVVYHK